MSALETLNFLLDSKISGYLGETVPMTKLGPNFFFSIKIFIGTKKNLLVLRVDNYGIVYYTF